MTTTQAVRILNENNLTVSTALTNGTLWMRQSADSVEAADVLRQHGFGAWAKWDGDAWYVKVSQ